MLCPQKRRFSDHWSMSEDGAALEVRAIVDKMQQRFVAGWSLPSAFSFDEGILPATSKRNTTRVFMPDKPHRYGSKMFMTCDFRTAFEFYAGKRAGDDGPDSSFDCKIGAVTVGRNLTNVLDSNFRHPWHVVVVDRAYTSILFAIELLHMGVYVVGTIMTNRLGYDEHVKESRSSRPASIPQGAFTFSRSVAVPNIVAFHW
ncbi:unnamed protein product [Phytophthora fragariaefolia]|uniref:Unnamed protein product n=1 Tax=Phytophthora fragariaefolia TaxID=1490495 RepID=A0A9W6Y3N7_9STRA|nr:unnamed protein product [Phytophthora fragariaefolia]